VKKIILLFAAIMVVFAVLLPFASTTPDGLETLTENSANPQQPVWNGLIADYSVALGNSYVSTLAAGLLGVGTVLGGSLALAAVMAQKRKTDASKRA
jgi:hypothetical protein